MFGTYFILLLMCTLIHFHIYLTCVLSVIVCHLCMYTFSHLFDVCSFRDSLSSMYVYIFTFI